MHQKGVINVLLNYERAVPFSSSADDGFYFLEGLAHFDSISSVGILTRFNDPGILGDLPHLLFQFCDLFVFHRIIIFIIASCTFSRVLYQLVF